MTETPSATLRAAAANLARHDISSDLIDAIAHATSCRLRLQALVMAADAGYRSVEEERSIQELYIDTVTADQACTDALARHIDNIQRRITHELAEVSSEVYRRFFDHAPTYLGDIDALLQECRRAPLRAEGGYRF